MNKHSSGVVTLSPDKKGGGENSAHVEVGAWGARVVGKARIPAWGGDAKDWAIYHLIEALAERDLAEERKGGGVAKIQDDMRAMGYRGWANDVDRLEQERDAERGRADALAAHVEQLNTAIDRALDYTPLHKNAHQRLRYVQLQQPETSLTQRDARVVAKTLDEIAVLLGAGATLAEITRYVADEIAAGGAQ